MLPSFSHSLWFLSASPFSTSSPLPSHKSRRWTIYYTVSFGLFEVTCDTKFRMHQGGHLWIETVYCFIRNYYKILSGIWSQQWHRWKHLWQTKLKSNSQKDDLCLQTPDLQLQWSSGLLTCPVSLKTILKWRSMSCPVPPKEKSLLFRKIHCLDINKSYVIYLANWDVMG